MITPDFNFMIMANMNDNPDWIFYRDNKPNEAEVMPRLIAEFPGFHARWEKHLESWHGEPAGHYNDIAQFVHFVVEDLYPTGKTADLQHAFELVEQWLVNGNRNLRDLIAIGFLEDLQNIASWKEFGREVFISFLGPQSHHAWNEIEKTWAGKMSLMEVIRAERKNP
jgi:hypothetical protein